jgi:cell division septation protein DedD
LRPQKDEFKVDPDYHRSDAKSRRRQFITRRRKSYHDEDGDEDGDGNKHNSNKENGLQFVRVQPITCKIKEQRSIKAAEDVLRLHNEAIAAARKAKAAARAEIPVTMRLSAKPSMKSLQKQQPVPASQPKPKPTMGKSSATAISEDEILNMLKNHNKSLEAKRHQRR